MLSLAEVMQLVRDLTSELGIRGVDPAALWFDLPAVFGRWATSMARAVITQRATYYGPTTTLNAVRGAGWTVDYLVVHRAIFTQPALASVGLTEQEAIDAGYGVKTGVAYFKHLGRAKAIGETAGLVKLVADVDTGQLLGGHILGPHADDLIHEIAVTMYNDGTAEPLYRSIHIHPTLSEVIKDAAKQLR